ncbi:phospho-N-acetylmuramoyl-pentapeptide-transferase [Clostridium sp. CAG:465]|nr:phospho-N-acetylmuramoyl-pentapeptide-transferase [Clostridium sp. CAG:465]
MNTQTLNLIVAFVATFVVGLFVMPILKKFKVGQVVRNDGPKEHLKKQGTPTMGGIIMLIVLVVILAINSIKYPTLILAIISILGFGLVGFIDDYKKLVKKNTKGLSPLKKIFGLVLVTAIFIFMYLKVFKLGTDITLPFISSPITLSVGAFIIFIAFILIGTSNAVNLTDGLDGLASGVVAIIMTFFTIVAVKNSNTEMIILGASSVGTCLAFLLFNFHPAKVFMGDTGSLALGGAVAAIAIMMKMEVYLAIVAFVCIIDTLSVILQVTYFKLTKGKRIFKMAPFHHHLELSGMKETKVVILFWVITAILCFVAYMV